MNSSLGPKVIGNSSFYTYYNLVFTGFIFLLPPVFKPTDITYLPCHWALQSGKKKGQRKALGTSSQYLLTRDFDLLLIVAL